MIPGDPPKPELLAEIEDLRARLADAEETLRAIRSGEVDALVVSGPEGDRVYTLKGEDRSYRVLVESVNEGALILTTDGIIMYANSTFARMIGVSLEKIIGASIDVFVHSGDREALKALLRDGARHAVRREMHLIRRSSSESLPVYISISPMVLDEASALSVVVTDLTEAKRTEQELARHRDHLEELVRERTAEVQETNQRLLNEIEERVVIESALAEREHKYRTLFTEIDEGYCVIEVLFDKNEKPIDYRFLEVNPAFEKQTGLVDAEGKRMRALAPEHEEHWFETYGRVALTGESVRFQNVAEQLHRFYDVYAFRVGEPEQRRVAILFNDITERKNQEKALAESESFFRAVYDSTQDAIVITDGEGTYISANPAAEDVFGLPQDQLVGRRVAEFMEPGFFDEMWPSFLEGGAFVAEHKLIAADGSERIVESHATAEMLPGRHLSVIHDVTGEVRLREQLTHQVALLQQALLPPAPRSIQGYAVASRYIPAFAGEQDIGGDFYDLFTTESGAIGLMIGDVSGRGIEAAALAAVTRSTVRAFAYDLSSPSAALNHANALLAAQQFGKYQFVTAFLALVDPATGEIRYASAGHPPAIVHCAGGAIGLLNTGSAPLGVLESPDYAEYTTRLDVGDRMVIYTDGISESRKGSTLFGTQGIERVLKEHRHEQPDVLAQTILEAAREFAEGKLRDDTALVIIHRS